MIQIQEISQKEAQAFFTAAKVSNRLPALIWKRLKAHGWNIVAEYSIERKHKGFFIVIEFCIGDFCVYVCSKNGHWLLEDKRSHPDFLNAMAEAQRYEMRIDRGEHWQGEND